MTTLIIDTDIQDDVDDVGAIAVACALASAGVQLAGIAVSTPAVWGARAATAVLAHYGVDAPVALERGDDVYGPEEFARGISRIFGTDRIDDFPRPVSMMRRVIAESSADITIAAIGFHSNLIALLDSGADEFSTLSGSELVRRRQVRLVVMGGCFVDVGPAEEYNFAHTPALTSRLFREWPGRIDVIPWELGASVITGRHLIDTQGLSSPVTLAYLLHSGHRTGRPSWDPITILAAAEHAMPGVVWSMPGTVQVGPLGAAVFSPEDGGSHRIASSSDDGEALARTIDLLLDAPVAEAAS